MVERAQAMIPPSRQPSSSFAVDHVAYKPATRYAEGQTRPGSSDSRVPITRLAVRWLHTVEAEKPIQLIGRPERVEPMAQSATSLMRRTVNPLIVQGTPFLLIFGAIMISAWYGGLGPGLLATFTAGLAADYFFLPPTDSFSVLSLETVPLLAFFLEGTLVCLLVEALRAARSRAEG